jgi:N-acetylmuramoyl-L-alanine amidase
VANASPYCYFVIDHKGQVAQPFPLNRWGSHAGTSYWKPIGSDVSKLLVGCEVMCAGKVEKRGERYMTWFGREVPKDQVVFSKKDENIQEGYYQRYTKDQFDSLVALCLWLKANNPDVFSFDNVVGHDTVSPSRKSDPGASLVNSVTNSIMTISEFRDFLKEEYKRKYVVI